MVKMADVEIARAVLTWGMVILMLISGFGLLVGLLAYIAAWVARIWRENK